MVLQVPRQATISIQGTLPLGLRDYKLAIRAGDLFAIEANYLGAARGPENKIPKVDGLTGFENTTADRRLLSSWSSENWFIVPTPRGTTSPDREPDRVGPLIAGMVLLRYEGRTPAVWQLAVSWPCS